MPRSEVVERDGILIPVSSCSLVEGDAGASVKREEVKTIMSRFRSLGCIPCTGAIKSNAENIDELIVEVINARKSERENRVIDLGSDSAMEDKKKEGYF